MQTLGQQTRTAQVRLYVLPYVQRHWRSLITLVLFAAIFVTVFVSKPVTFSPDEAYYMVIGRNIAAGKGPMDNFGELAAEHPPLFSMLLAVLFHLLGATLATATILPKLIAVANVCLIYAIGRQLSGWRTGVLAAILASSSLYMLRFSGRILLDNALACFMLASLLAIIIAVCDSKWRFAVLSGAMLGCGFLVKEAALVWLPLPFILILFARASSIVKPAAAYLLGFGGTVIWWWLYFYARTGKLFLLHAPNREFGLITLLLAALAVAAFGLGLTLFVRARNPALFAAVSAKVLSPDPRPSLAAGLLLLCTAWLGLTLMLLKVGAPLSGLAGVPGRIAATVEYIRDVWLSIEQWQSISLVAWLLLLAQATRRKVPVLAAVLGFALYFPLLFSISVPTTGVFPARQFQTLLWLSYAAVAHLLISVLDYSLHLIVRLLPSDHVPSRQGRYVQLAAGAGFAALISWLGVPVVQQNWEFTVQNQQFDFMQSTGSTLTQSTANLAGWLTEQHEPVDTIYTSPSLARELAWVTGGAYDTKALASGFRGEWYRDWIVDAPGADKYSFVAGDIADEASDLLYLEPYVLGFRSPRYFALSIDKLAFIDNADEPYYLAVMSGPRLRSNFKELPSFFADLPQFQLLYRDTWSDRTTHVFRVDGGVLAADAFAGYPLSIASDTVMWWADNAQDPAAAPTVLALIEQLAQKPFVILGDNAQKPRLYRFLAETLLQLQKPDLAAFAYRQMLAHDKTLAGELLTTASALASAYSSNADVWALSGDVYLALQQLEQARESYLNALSARNTTPEAMGAAYLGLASYSIMQNDLLAAEAYLQQAEAASIYGSAQARYLQSVVHAYTAFLAGNHQQAQDSLQQAITSLPQQAVGDFLNRTFLDIAAATFYDAGFDFVFTQALIEMVGYEPLLATITEDRHPWQGTSQDSQLVLLLLDSVQQELGSDQFERSVYRSLASIYHSLDRPYEAYTVYSKIQADSSPAADIWLQMGELAEQMGDPGLAMDTYKRALLLDQSQTTTVDRIVNLAQRVDELDETLLWLEELNQEKPFSAAAHLELGKALLLAAAAHNRVE